jgi:hypothetical protein
VINVNRRNVTPENFNGFLSAISLVNSPRELFLELFRRPASNNVRGKIKGAADENPGFAALIELWRKRSLFRVMKNSCG